AATGWGHSTVQSEPPAGRGAESTEKFRQIQCRASTFRGAPTGAASAGERCFVAPPRRPDERRLAARGDIANALSTRALAHCAASASRRTRGAGAGGRARSRLASEPHVAAAARPSARGVRPLAFELQETHARSAQILLDERRHAALLAQALLQRPKRFGVEPGGLAEQDQRFVRGGLGLRETEH